MTATRPVDVDYAMDNYRLFYDAAVRRLARGDDGRFVIAESYARRALREATAAVVATGGMPQPVHAAAAASALHTLCADMLEEWHRACEERAEYNPDSYTYRSRD